MNVRYLDRAEVPAVILRSSGYNGRKFRLYVSEQVTLSGAYWDGGSRTTWRAVDLGNGRAMDPSAVIKNPPQFGGPREAPTVDIPPNVAVFGHSILCGKDAGLTIYIRPENAAALLPAPAELALSRQAQIVLSATCGLKSFARRDAAARHGVSAAAYAAALVELEAAGLVTARGAATTAGDNAREQLPRELRQL